MKTNFKNVAAVACSALMLCSCTVYDYPVYTGASVSVGGHGWNTSVAWSNASYDVNGFPIFGYYYGQPVYGYTATGAAVFTFAALTAACLVPDWGPASWYCGHWHYPHHVRRVRVPHRYPAGHFPGNRPHLGHRPHHSSPVVHRPGGGHKPHLGNRPGSSAPRPQLGNRPGNSTPRPQLGSRPGNTTPRPQLGNRPGNSTPRPQQGNRPGNATPRPQLGKPSAHRPRTPGMGHRSPGGMVRPSGRASHIGSGGRASRGGGHRSRGGHRR